MTTLKEFDATTLADIERIYEELGSKEAWVRTADLTQALANEVIQQSTTITEMTLQLGVCAIAGTKPDQEAGKAKQAAALENLKRGKKLEGIVERLHELDASHCEGRR